MGNRFSNWKYPDIIDGKPTKYNWVVQNIQDFNLGFETDIGAFSYINALHGVDIKDYVQIGSHCSIYSVSTIDDSCGQVVLEQNCRIGSHSIILPGVSIGKNSIIGAHSLVNKDIPDNVVAFGVPAKVVRQLNNEFSPWPSFTQEEADSVQDVLLSNKVNYWTGDECNKFEKEFSEFSGSKYAVALGNGTLALDVALKVLDIGDGDEVIVTSRTFIASISSIVNSGAAPIFADVDLSSQNTTPETIRSVITYKTKALVCVHLAGWPCDMDEIMAIANEHDLYVIEDCAQAHGAKYKDNPVGSIGHIGCWSFCQDKIMTTGGEGGMVTTNDESLWRNMWAYKDHGKSYEAVYEREHSEGFRWLHESFGTNWRMTEIQAVIGRIQLKRMPDWHRKRLNNANSIWNTAKQCKGLRVPTIPNYIEHAAYKCYVFVKPKALKNDWSRDRIIKEINALGVPCYFGSCSEVYLEKAFENTAFRPKERLPNAKELGEASLMFLVHPTLTENEIQQTCDAIIRVMEMAVN